MNLMLKSFPFVLLFMAVVFTIGFNTPKDFLQSEASAQSDNSRGLTTTETAPTVAMLASDTPSAPYVTQIEDSGCLDRLSALPPEMIEHCSELVAAAIIQIASYEGLDNDNLTTESGLLVERLRLAAANVCRARWATNPELIYDNDDPVCKVSTVGLVGTN